MKSFKSDFCYDRSFSRGEIYWVENDNAIGSEMAKNRPAVLVGCQPLLDTSGVVSIVFLSSVPEQKSMPEHVVIHSGDRLSVAKCENVYTVDKSRLSKKIGSVTAEELLAIDRAVARGIFNCDLPSPEAEDLQEDTETGHRLQEQELKDLIEKLDAERMMAVSSKQAYKEMLRYTLEIITKNGGQAS